MCPWASTRAKPIFRLTPRRGQSLVVLALALVWLVWEDKDEPVLWSAVAGRRGTGETLPDTTSG